MTYLQQHTSAPSPQSEPIFGRRDMVENSAGGFTFALDKFGHLRRFLILGSEGGSYYTGERELTRENAQNVLDCIMEDGVRTVEIIQEMASDAPKVDAPLFALALCLAHGDVATRRSASIVLPNVAVTATHLMQFVSYAVSQRGWGRALRNAVARWYETKTPKQLGYQIVKYRSRHGWTHRDLLLKAHAKPLNDAYNTVYHYAAKGVLPYESMDTDDFDLIKVFERIQKGVSDDELVEIIKEHTDVTWEMVSTEALKNPKVWEALLQEMPVVAMLRNLATMTRVGVISPFSNGANRVVQNLTWHLELGRRLHPISILSALKTYASGHGVRSDTSWTPVPQVVDALDSSFDKAFANEPAIDQRIYVGVDVSGSMSAPIEGIPNMTAREGAATLAMLIARREPQYYIAGFQSDRNKPGYRGGLIPPTMADLNIRASDSLDDVMRKTNEMPFGATDCAVPMLDALDKNMPVDLFVIITDNESWAGQIHASEAIKKYRKETGINAKLAVIAMSATEYSIADPTDVGMADFVGFDSGLPIALRQFANGFDR